MRMIIVFFLWEGLFGLHGADTKMSNSKDLFVLIMWNLSYITDFYKPKSAINANN